ncbi:HlyD family secretion protein [Haloimpatiens sp. FM7315]|uniref:HlyD family secretion protein n=1 Tax=Haloimpatiens sp. FM7315 TaxID=3298609 RepID=UPI00370B02C7
MKRKKFILTIICLSFITLIGCTNNTEEKNKYTGTVECDSYYVTSEIGGILNKLMVQQGNSVENHQNIGEIDTKSYEIERDNAEGALKVAEAKYDSVKNIKDENIKKQAEGLVIQAKAAVNLAKLNISKCNVKSIKNGIVEQVLTHEGELVQPGTNIIKIMDINNKYIKIYLEESKRNKVKLQDELNIFYNGKKVGIGKVAYIAKKSEFTPKNTETKEEKEDTTFEVKLKFLEKNSFSPGTMLDVEIK